ncbi:hypothetical protein GOP47_0001552 [Adiantum capillus-veneris]|uniref:DUF547 domain-containing protein n=1 Tax=Adiantum capillus-veneris TaxID=13818 RepID=A0A9D4V8K7_ADICA|nr:hypothetical protein GOP47_0001552 [Adiantum capillus-veneris]
MGDELGELAESCSGEARQLGTHAVQGPLHSCTQLAGCSSNQLTSSHSFATPMLLLPVSSESTDNGLVIPKHCRSKSAPENTLKLLVKDMTPQFAQASNLNKRLKIDRHVSKKLQIEEERHSAVLFLQGRRHTTTVEAKELVEEISFLEGEIADLEQYVLTLYRSLFSKCVIPSSPVFCKKYKSSILDKRKELRSPRQVGPPKHSPKAKAPSQHNVDDNATENSSNIGKVASTVHEKTRQAPKLCESVEVARPCQVPLTRSPQQIKIHQAASEPKTVRSILRVDEDSSPRLLKDYLSETPNQLSEDLVRCMSNVYWKLSVSPPAPISSGIPESPLSSSSSLTSISSMHGMFSDGWSPASRPEPSMCDTPLADPFQVKGNHGCRRAYHDMVEVPHICTDKDRLNNATRMLRNFRSMVEKLERVDPSQLKHNEKLAFWINIYNALIMHAYLAYGIPRNNLKRMSVLQKASYKVGGHTINAHTIEHYILRCNFHRPSQWLQNLLSPVLKLKSGDGRRAFAIDRVEPLICFALCCGGRSDPAVRVYTSKHVHGELETAMKEYLQASIGFQNSKRILLPKVLEWYMKEASLSSNYLLDWIAQQNHASCDCTTLLHAKRLACLRSFDTYWAVFCLKDASRTYVAFTKSTTL